MELRHLRYFVTAAQELNISRAAARLRVSQPPLSRQIRDLEEEIGTALFDRSSKRLQLTAAGELFLQEARRILSQVERARRITKATGSGQAGLITIGFPGSLGGVFLPEIVRAFRHRHPTVDVDLVDMVPIRQLEALRNGQIDLAFVAQVEVESANEFVFEIVMHVRLHVALALDHRLSGSAPIALHELRDEAFISVKQPATHELFLRLCRSAGFEPYVAKQADLSQSILDLVAAGVGVAILPEHFRRYQAAVAMRPLVARPGSVPLCMAWRKDDEFPPLHDLRAMVLGRLRGQESGGNPGTIP
jgi:DNA-binding transcriptional LysR family regulator